MSWRECVDERFATSVSGFGRLSRRSVSHHLRCCEQRDGSLWRYVNLSSSVFSSISWPAAHHRRIARDPPTGPVMTNRGHPRLPKVGSTNAGPLGSPELNLIDPSFRDVDGNIHAPICN